MRSAISRGRDGKMRRAGTEGRKWCGSGAAEGEGVQARGQEATFTDQDLEHHTSRVGARMHGILEQGLGGDSGVFLRNAIYRNLA